MRTTTQKRLIAVGRALLPYLRNDLTDAELGKATHDAAAAVNATAESRISALEALLGEASERLGKLVGAAEVMPSRNSEELIELSVELKLSEATLAKLKARTGDGGDHA